MQFSDLASYFQRFEDTSSRLALIETLAELFASIRIPAEIEQVCFLVQGRVAPPFEPLEIGMADKTVARAIARAYHTPAAAVTALYDRLGDLGVVAERCNTQAGGRETAVTVDEVFNTLSTIAGTGGKGAIEKRIALLADLLQRIDGLSAKYLVRIPLGKLRLGIGDPTLLEALAQAKLGERGGRQALEAAYNRTSDLGQIARTLWSQPDPAQALSAVRRLEVQVGKPLRPELCERLPGVEQVLAKMGEVEAQYKYDGFRTQIHKNGQQIRVFSRNLEDMSAMFPEIVEGARRQIRAHSAILDGEALAYHPESEEFLPFQETTRRRRKHRIAEVAQQLPLRVFLFDLLYKDGESLLERPLTERLAILNETVAADDVLMLTQTWTVRDPHQLALLLQEAISKGLEGLVVKKPDSPYEAGGRSFNWVKLKRHQRGQLRDTIDCVLLGYLYGRGKRAAFGVGALLVGIYDPAQDLFVTVTKIGTGLSDAEWRSIKERTKGLEVEHKPARVSSLITPSVWVEPELVIEVLADEITRSPVHTAGKVGDEPGYALRFPRLVSFRDKDKQPEDATTVQELIELYQNQGNIPQPG